MATEQDHVWAMLDDMLVFLSKRHVPTPERTYKLDGGWTLAMDDLRRFVDNLTAERDQLRAELAAAKNLLARIHRDGGHHTEAVGVTNSITDAHEKWSELLLENHNLKNELAAAAETLAVFRKNIMRDNYCDCRACNPANLPESNGWKCVTSYRADALLLAAAELIRAGGWRPIAEAPSDRTLILVGRWHRGKWQWKETWFAGQAAEDGYTHYLPEPAPPAREESKSKNGEENDRQNQDNKCIG